MKKIRLLDINTINKIAAGEVVERPSSVVKELVENSIDAGASAVVIEIKGGGMEQIKITDNGRGIPKDEVETAFIRHATNKIEKVEDLEEVASLGFRGEALASIAAVAQVEIITKTADAETGARMEIHGGQILAQEEIGCADGTVITVDNLFYNVPARRKFLKKPATESGYVTEMVQRFALGHPEVSIKFLNNGTLVLHTAGNNRLDTAVFHVYGKEVAKRMEVLDFHAHGYWIHGYIGKPELSRANRSYENLFINGRFVKSDLVASAVEEAYKTRLMVGKFPVYVLNLEVSPSIVDVNVHPTKLEVRFQNEDEIYGYFYQATSEVLKKLVLIPEADWGGKPSPEVAQYLKVEKETQPQQQTLENITSADWQKEPKKETVVFTQEELERIQRGSGIDALLQKDKPEKTLLVSQNTAKYKNNPSPPTSNVQEEPLIFEEQIESGEQQERRKKDLPQEKRPFFHHYTIVGQIFRTYWIVEQQDSVFLIDQHAAHERVLFEEFSRQFQSGEVLSQRLVQPIAINLTLKEAQTVAEHMDFFQRFGFEIEEFGQSAYALRAVPYLLKDPVDYSFFVDIVDKLAEGRMQHIYDTKIHEIATIACKAAVKAHDRLSFQEAKELIEKLLTLENPFTCPHGRPTMIEMTKYELEKKFKRIQ